MIYENEYDKDVFTVALKMRDFLLKELTDVEGGAWCEFHREFKSDPWDDVTIALDLKIDTDNEYFYRYDMVLRIDDRKRCEFNGYGRSFCEEDADNLVFDCISHANQTFTHD